MGHAHFKFVGKPDDPANGMNALPQSIAGIEFFNKDDIIEVSDIFVANELRKNEAVEEVGYFEPTEEPPPPEGGATRAKKAEDDKRK